MFMYTNTKIINVNLQYLLSRIASIFHPPYLMVYQKTDVKAVYLKSKFCQLEDFDTITTKLVSFLSLCKHEMITMINTAGFSLFAS